MNEKKQWKLPEFVIIQTGYIEAKHFNSVHEGTGHVTTTVSSNVIFFTPNNQQGFALRTQGGAWIHNQSEAIS